MVIKNGAAIQKSIFVVEQYYVNNKNLIAKVLNFHWKYGQNSDLAPLSVKR